MIKQKINNKFIFLGDTDSINIEIIIKSFFLLRNKVRYIILCDIRDFESNYYFKSSKIQINEIINPVSFENYNKFCINIFNIKNISKKKYQNLINQINIGNQLSNSTGFDLVTMPINKSIFKKNMKFIGMTEYLGSLNKKKTFMLMSGDKFSIIPLTTHINLKNVFRLVTSNKLELYIDDIFKIINKSNFKLKFNNINFLCYNPHCSEEKTLGEEDFKINKIISKYKNINGPYPADSAFQKYEKNTLFLSTYHDQALIPFKILNKKSCNLTIGLNYQRLSPSHGTAKDLKYKNCADTTSYLVCLLF